MPQLDLSAFLTNFFWLILIFFTLYSLILKVFLPRIVKSFIFRFEFTNSLLNSSLFSKFTLDYYTSLFQFLEFSLNTILLKEIFPSFTNSIEFQNEFFFDLLLDSSESESVLDSDILAID